MRTHPSSEGRLVLYPYMQRNGDILPLVVLPDGFEANPKPLGIGEHIPDGFAVVLVGFAGAQSVESLRFDHSSSQSIAMNATFSARSNTVLAFAIPGGIKSLGLVSVGIGRSPFANSTDGWGRVISRKVDVNRPGVYYLATLDTDHPGKVLATPLPELLKKFRTDYADTVGTLEPINFSWPF